MSRERTARDGSTGERGVSAVLSFVLVFGIVLGSVAVLSVAGFGLLDDQREVEELRAAERGVTNLAADLDELARYDGLERRTAALPAGDGTLVVDEGGTELEVAVDGDPVTDEGTIELGTLSYRSGSETVAYDGGAVVRSGEAGSQLRRQPAASCREERGTVSLVRLETDGRSIHAGGQVAVTARVVERSSRTIDVEDSVTVTAVETDHEEVWEQLENEWADCDPDQVRLTVTTVLLET
ncbi:hypothetical protein C491_10819 [Natronococcus amylolyticus DSM 10524]|uniref:Uncharacterized protein n=1 Tax=Natronococcus amylolyticus DSM 10524 TaxID=1227497 RepID=L9X6P1_9EURY|nr:hypothetical protein [Natronococcus amylolyticus]ELY57272.1 hypothetical protein C491_10819 [Natronococcus amylolyticus DSM 10524]